MIFLCYLQKHAFFQFRRIKGKNVKKESKFYATNFMDPLIIFKKKILTPRATKTHIQKSYKGKRCVQGL